MKRLLPLLLAVSFLSGCAGLSAITSLIPGNDGGTDVAANTQIGAENTQNGVVGQQTELTTGDNGTVRQVEADESTENNISAGDNASVETVDADQSNRVTGTQIINQDVPLWLWAVIILLAGWAIPTPMDMAIGIVNFFRLLFGKELLRR